MAVDQCAVDDLDIQNLQQREFLFVAGGGELQLSRDDLEVDSVAVPGGVIPMGEVVEPAIDRRQGVAEVLLTVFAPSEVREVRGGPLNYPTGSSARRIGWW